MREDYYYDNSISYPSPYNIPVPEDLNFHNSAAELHAIMKGHVAAKYEAKRKYHEKKRKQENLG